MVILDFPAAVVDNTCSNLDSIAPSWRLSLGRHINKPVKFMIQCSKEIMNVNSMDPNDKVKWIAK